MVEIRTVKREIREKYVAERKNMPKEQREAFDSKIYDRICASITYRHCTQILLYASTE